MENQIITPDKPRVFYSDQITDLRRRSIDGKSRTIWAEHPRLLEIGIEWARGMFGRLLDVRGMASFYSDQVTNMRATPRVLVRPTDLQGRVRVAYWTYTTPAASAPAIADFVTTTLLPANARELNMMAQWEAMSSGAGTAGADHGPATDDQGTGFANDYVAALNMDAAGFKVFDAVLDKLPRATVSTSLKYVAAKVTGEALATTKKYQGFISYVID